MIEHEADRILDFLCRRWEREAKIWKLKKIFIEEERIFIEEDEWIKSGCLMGVIKSMKCSKRPFIFTDGKFIDCVKMRIGASKSTILKKLLKIAQQSDVFLTRNTAFIKRDESWEELLVQADLGDIND